MFNGGCILFNINDNIGNLLNFNILNLQLSKSVFIFNSSSYSNLLKMKIQKYTCSYTELKNIKLFSEDNYNQAIKYILTNNIENIIIFDKNILKKIKYDINLNKIKNIWWISYNFKIIDLISLIQTTNDIDNKYFLNINNLHQLSRIITPISNQIKRINRPHIIELNKVLKNLITISKNIVFKEPDLQHGLDNECPICRECTTNFIKFGCGHIVCSECFTQFTNIDKTAQSKIACVQCTQSVKNKNIEICLFKSDNLIFNEDIFSKFISIVYKFINKHSTKKIGIINTDKLSYFLKNLINFMYPNREIYIYNEYSKLFSLKNYCFITDYTDVSCLANSKILILK